MALDWSPAAFPLSGSPLDEDRRSTTRIGPVDGIIATRHKGPGHPVSNRIGLQEPPRRGSYTRAL